MTADIITVVLSFVITLMILSYLIGDNLFFRIATYLFVGVSAGYIAAVAIHQVLYPKLIVPLMSGNAALRGVMIFPLFLALLIFLKASPRLTKAGSPAMAYLVGVGAAVAIGGAWIGTLVPQMAATINRFDSLAGRDFFDLMLNGGVILIGAVTSLAYFHFGARPNPEGAARRNVILEGFAWVGRIFIAITLGAIFAGVYAAALTAFIERISSIITFFSYFRP
ncbi:MAG: hypothetical protein AB1649_13275 [Chloroflexota bacterium]